MTKWQHDKRWSDKFIPVIKHILADVFVCEAPEFEDQRHNTDLMVFMLKPARVACRIRRHKYFIDYPYDITIRKDRPSGSDSEMAKLISGYGDYFFYGFSNLPETDLCAWTLVDLFQFRLWLSRCLVLNKGSLPGVEQENKDKSSVFQVFNKKLFSKNIIFREYSTPINSHQVRGPTMKTASQNSIDAADATILKIMKRQEAYHALNQASPRLEDDEAMDALMEQLLDELGCTAE